MPSYTLDEVRVRACRERDSWWTVWAVDPLAIRLVRLVANRTSITPNQLTVAVLLLGLGAAACFAVGLWPFLIAGAVLYYLCFLADCMDGKLARLTSRESLFGSWMDYVFDRFRVLVCAIALMGGQYVLTGRIVFVWLALAVVFCDMLRYLNALQVYKVRREMRSRLAAVLEWARATLSMLESDEKDEKRAAGQPLSDLGSRRCCGMAFRCWRTCCDRRRRRRTAPTGRRGNSRMCGCPGWTCTRGFGPGFPGTRNSGISCGGGVSALTW